MAITFPASPTISQIFTSGNKSWIWDGTTWLAYGASLSPTVLKVDTANLRVGINNQSPAATLDVQTITGTAVSITNTGTGNSFLVEDSASTDSTPFVIDAAGLVGVGTTTPGARFDVQESGSTVAMRITNAGSQNSFVVEDSTSTDTSPFVISATGNVGIGLTSPSAKLDIIGAQIVRAGSTQDGVQLQGRAGGTSSWSTLLIPTTLTASRTLTLPDKTGTVALTSDPGLILVKTQTVGTGVSSVTVTGAFSTDYDNYKITYIGGTCSASTDIEMTIGGSATGYYGFLSYGITTLASNQAAVKNNATAFPWVGGGAAGQASHVHVEIMGPFKAAYTKIRNGSYQNDNNYGTMQGEHRVATSYTSFALAVLTGTMTGGTIRVYGYRNS